MKKTASFLIILCLLGFGIPESNPTIFLIGDSTMADKPLEGNPERGWGQLFPQYLLPGIQVQNHAMNGRSTKSFIKEGRWDTVMSRMRKGDYVLIQFGHNDQKVEDTNRSAPAHGLYKENLIRFVNETRRKGGFPILMTPVMRRKFDEKGIFVDQHGDYPNVVKEVAALLKVPMIDLHKSSETLIVKEGVEGSKRLFLNIPAQHFKNYKGKEEDNTHFSEYGAASMASLVCQSIVDQQLPLAAFLKPSLFQAKYQFELPKIYTPHFRQDTLSILANGAVADGKTLNSVAINKTIDQMAAKGGGVVKIPAGLWLTGPIVMKSNINLYVAENALVIFTSDLSQYPLVVSSFEGVDAARCQSPINAENMSNIAITGKGIFDGNGFYWRPLKKEKMNESGWKNHLQTYGGALTEDKKTWYPSEAAVKASLDKNIGKLTEGKKLSDFEGIKDFLRPNMVRIANSKNILIEGVTFNNSPAWTTHILSSEHITIKGLVVKNPWYGTNTDALDLESCKNILMEDCVFDTGDDGITIKSGRDEDGRKRGMPTQDMIVNNCTVYHAHGGFVIGSEMSGGARNLYVGNCTFIGTDIGLRFKTTRGRGGMVENIYASNIVMKDIAAEAILFDMYYMAKDPVVLAGEKREPPVVEILPVTEATPQFQHFFFNNITCNGASKAIFIRGIPEMHVKDVQMSNVFIQANEGLDIQEASEIQLNHITVHANNKNPLVYTLNSNDIKIKEFDFSNKSEIFLQAHGPRTKTVSIALKNGQKIKNDIGFGADAKTIEIK
jgi:DNA sulfur modification protein DndE